MNIIFLRAFAATPAYDFDFSEHHAARAVRATRRSTLRVLLFAAVIAGVALNTASCTTTPGDSAAFAANDGG